MANREEKTYHGSTYHTWSDASGVGHFPEWLSKEDEQCLHEVIDLLAAQGYHYYEVVTSFACIEYITSHARGEGRVVTFDHRGFFLRGVSKQSLLARLAHTQTYLMRSQADAICLEILHQFPDWQATVYHASQDIKSLSPQWDEWRVVAMGIYKDRKAWRWTVGEPREWQIYCRTMERDHRMLYSQVA